MLPPNPPLRISTNSSLRSSAEMRKTSAAIEAYRRAVDINARDYRAWYGLGQVYEILNMLLYALYYYRKAAALRPYDARMWCALGSCFLSLDRRQEAIKSYERGEKQRRANDDNEERIDELGMR